MGAGKEQRRERRREFYTLSKVLELGSWIKGPEAPVSGVLIYCVTSDEPGHQTGPGRPANKVNICHLPWNVPEIMRLMFRYRLPLPITEIQAQQFKLIQIHPAGKWKSRCEPGLEAPKPFLFLRQCTASLGHTLCRNEIAALSPVELETDTISKKNVKNKCYGNKLPMI